MEVGMTAHTLLPLRRFAVVHPYAAEWVVLITATVVALLLWFSNS
jgi:hypothetical protein